MRMLLVVSIGLFPTTIAAAEDSADNVLAFSRLLDEMIDRDNVARLPEPEYRLRQQSSYDRKSKTPTDPNGWFANADRGNFIRTEENDGRQEWVVMEHDGPGVMGRMWMPDPRITPMVLSGRRKPPRDLGTIRFYLDGESKPALEGPTYDLLNGTLLAGFPFGHKSLSSAVSYLPIPWAKSCKITTDVRPQYYIFTYREYPAGTNVKSFTMEDFAEAREHLRQVGTVLVEPPTAIATWTKAESKLIAPRDMLRLRLPDGPHAVRTLSVKLDDRDNPQLTRSVVLQCEFDDHQTLWCPIGDFFGTGVGWHRYQGWYRTVGRDGAMTCRWVMPYQQSATISLINLDDDPVDVRLEVSAGNWEWDNRSLYFHSRWRHESEIPTRPRSDWNYITLTGRGVYVGDTLTVWNPREIWWGEGDAKIWVDGESFPSIFGTGTEDYYAYAYGGQNRAFYQHPFHAQVRVMGFDQDFRGDVPIVRVTKGYSTETRTRVIDAMPFGKSLKVDMEIWHWEDCAMNYNVATYWYATPGTTCNVPPDPDAARQPVKAAHSGSAHSRSDGAASWPRARLGGGVQNSKHQVTNPICV